MDLESLASTPYTEEKLTKLVAILTERGGATDSSIFIDLIDRGAFGFLQLGQIAKASQTWNMIWFNAFPFSGPSVQMSKALIHASGAHIQNGNALDAASLAKWALGAT